MEKPFYARHLPCLLVISMKISYECGQLGEKVIWSFGKIGDQFIRDNKEFLVK
jgi:hypothetical protein